METIGECQFSDNNAINTKNVGCNQKIMLFSSEKELQGKYYFAKERCSGILSIALAALS
jgi:hypothetical protein